MKTVAINFPGMSLLDVREKYTDCFYDQSWYDKQPFAKEKIPAGRWEVSLEPVEDSTNKSWVEQQKLLTKGNEVPPIAVLVYAMCVHFKWTGERAFERLYVRTSSRDSDGDRVVVGCFDASGLNVYNHWDDSRNGNLGLASARLWGPETLDSIESLSARVADLEAWRARMIKALSPLT